MPFAEILTGLAGKVRLPFKSIQDTVIKVIGRFTINSREWGTLEMNMS